MMTVVLKERFCAVKFIVTGPVDEVGEVVAVLVAVALAAGVEVEVAAAVAVAVAEGVEVAVEVAVEEAAGVAAADGDGEGLGEAVMRGLINTAQTATTGGLRGMELESTISTAKK
jgi:hypothetical protein